MSQVELFGPDRQLIATSDDDGRFNPAVEITESGVYYIGGLGITLPAGMRITTATRVDGTPSA